MSKSKLSSLEFRQTPTKGKKAAIYVRVSIDEFKSKNKADAEKEYRQSVISQEQRGILCAKENGWQYEVYKNDCGQSGFTTPSETERQDLYRIMQEIKEGKIHTLVVRDQKRLTRSTQFAQNLLHDVLLKYGVDIKGWGERIDIGTPTGQIIFGLQSQFAQQELQYTRRRSMESKEDLLIYAVHPTN